MHVTAYQSPNKYKPTSGRVYVEITGYASNDSTVGTAITESYDNSALLVKQIVKLVEAHNEVWPENKINLTEAIQ